MNSTKNAASRSPKPLNPQIRVHVVAGDPVAGKGTMVRHLSGCRIRSDAWHLSVAGTSCVFAVRLSSLQEGQQGIMPLVFINEIHHIQTPVTDVLIPLRLRCRGLFPDYLSYLTVFQNAGWQIASLAFLSPPVGNINIPIGSIFQLPLPHAWSSSPSNVVADDIRVAWGW